MNGMQPVRAAGPMAPLVEPALAVVHSPRASWSSDLHRHVANHGGARVKRMVVEPRVALEEDYDIFVCDEATSFLSQHFVDRLHAGGVRLLGVYDADEPAGRERLARLGFDGVVEAGAPVEAFLQEIRRLAPGDAVGERCRSEAGAAQPPVGSPRACRVVVGAASGGSGATEVAIALASAFACWDRTLLFDADDVSPAVPIRLNRPLSPNIRNAVDACEHGLGRMADAIRPVHDGGFELLAGLPRASDWAQLRISEVENVLARLASSFANIVINVGSQREDLSPLGGLDRYVLTRAMYQAADVIVGVGMPSPAGVVRLLEWAADASGFAPEAPTHLVVSRAPVGGYKQAELTEEILRTFEPASLTLLPADRRVEDAGWACELVTRGPFARGVARLAVIVAGPARCTPTRARGLPS